MQDGARIWRESLAELERVARPWILAVWLRPTTGLDDDESFLTVAVPSVFHKQYLEQELPRLIASAVCAARYGTLRVQYCVASLPALTITGRARHQVVSARLSRCRPTLCPRTCSPGQPSN